MGFKDYIKFILKAVYPFVMATFACLAGIKYSVLAMDIFSGGFFDPIKTFEKEKNKPFKYDSTFNSSGAVKADLIAMPARDGLESLNKIDNQMPPSEQAPDSPPVSSFAADARASQQSVPADVASNVASLNPNINSNVNQISEYPVQQGVASGVSNTTNLQTQPAQVQVVPSIANTQNIQQQQATIGVATNKNQIIHQGIQPSSPNTSLQTQQQKTPTVAQNTNQLRLVQNYKKNNEQSMQQPLQQNFQNINQEANIGSAVNQNNTNSVIEQHQINQSTGAASVGFLEAGQDINIVDSKNQQTNYSTKQAPTSTPEIKKNINIQPNYISRKIKKTKFKKSQAETIVEEDDMAEEDEENGDPEVNEYQEVEPQQEASLPRKKKFNKRFYKKNYKKRYKKRVQ
jgi:hypothetical protein